MGTTEHKRAEPSSAHGRSLAGRTPPGLSPRPIVRGRPPARALPLRVHRGRRAHPCACRDSPDGRRTHQSWVGSGAIESSRGTEERWPEGRDGFVPATRVYGSGSVADGILGAIRAALLVGRG